MSISAESDALLVPLIGSFALVGRWSLATTVGPFETTPMITLLLKGWLPPVIDGQPRDQVIADLLPAGARWWAAFGPLPIIATIWAYEVWRRKGLVHIRDFLAEEETG